MSASRSDAELLTAWREGDAAAGSALVHRRMGKMIRFFRNKVSSEADIPDLVNQTFLGCVSSRDGFRGDTSFRRFVYQIAQNVLYDYIRRRSKRQRENLDFAVVCVRDVAPQSASSIITARRETRALVEGLRHIPLDDQVVLELMYFEGWSGAKIAEGLGLPEGTVRGRIRRGLDRLRAWVEQSLATGSTDEPPTLDDLTRWATEIREQVTGTGDE